jgi:hypothetical protein
LPSLDDLTQKESTSQKPLKPALIDCGLARPEEVSRVRRDQIQGLALQVAQMTSQALVFAGR